MMSLDEFDIAFSGIRIRFLPGAPVVLPPELDILRCDMGEPVDAQVDVLPLHRPMTFLSEPVCDNQGIKIYETAQGQWRVYPLRRDENGSSVVCYIGRDGHHQLYYPAGLWNHYTRPMHCMHLIGIENILLRADGFLLHSSVVSYKGKGILLAGPSGVGKSTQALLWNKLHGADILNGDRCVVRCCDGVFYGGGSPCAGHSLIYRADSVPVAGIILLEQSRENELRQAGVRAVPGLMSQILVNSWDIGFMNRVSELLQQLLESVPCYILRCAPGDEAVALVKAALFPD